MKNWKNLNWLPVYITIAAVVSACGAASTGTFSSGLVGNTTGGLTGGSGGGGGGGGGGGTGGGGGGGSNPGLAPPLQFAQFGVTGAGGQTPVYSTKDNNGAYISTDNDLKVRVKVAPGGLLQAPSGYSGFSTNYSCASFTVSIYDDTGTQIGSASTQLLQVPGQPPCNPGQNTPSYQDLDFSSSVTGPHGGIEVRVQADQYDFYCKLWWQEYEFYGPSSPYYQYYGFWCPSKAVYKNHTVDASLEVEVNGTQLPPDGS